MDSNTVVLRTPYAKRKFPNSVTEISSSGSSHPCWWFFLRYQIPQEVAATIGENPNNNGADVTGVVPSGVSRRTCELQLCEAKVKV